MRPDRQQRQSRGGGEQAPVTAVCTAEGEEPILLPVVKLSRKGVVVQAMRMPSISQLLTLAIHPCGAAPIGPVQARVIAARLDPGDFDRCGFEVVFVNLDDVTLARLDQTAESMAPRPAPPPPSSRARERREYPRVDADLRAYIAFADHTAAFKVDNISMSGALLAERDACTSLVDLAPGTELTVTIVEHSTPESVQVEAAVVRVRLDDGVCTVAVRFCELCETTARRLEGLILYQLIAGGFPQPWADDVAVGGLPI